MPPANFDYKLTDLLSSAGATIGIIIGGTIFLQFLSSKYTALTGGLRTLAADYRGKADDEPRHAPLRSQIQLYGHRLVLLYWAATFGAVALLSLLASVLAGALSMVFPTSRTIQLLGTGSLIVGLMLVAAAVALEVVETVVARKEITNEIADLDEDAKRWRR